MHELRAGDRVLAADSQGNWALEYHTLILFS